jgi:hypothetical protein
MIDDLDLAEQRSASIDLKGPKNRRRHTAYTGQRLINAMAASPLGDLEFERISVSGPVRDIDL